MPDEQSFKKGLLLEDYEPTTKTTHYCFGGAQDIKMEGDDFVRFTIDFTANIRDKWWDLDWENHKRGEQVLFNGEIYSYNYAKVHTPKLSSIYRLGSNKKALENVSNAHLEELAGTAPASAGLSWLVIYRFSLFCCLRERVSKQTNISF